MQGLEGKRRGEGEGTKMEGQGKRRTPDFRTWIRLMHERYVDLSQILSYKHAQQQCITHRTVAIR